MAVLENLWALRTEGLFDIIVALLAAPPLPGEARYVLRLPEGQRAEFHQSAHNNSAVHRGRLIGYFEREDVAAVLPAPSHALDTIQVSGVAAPLGFILDAIDSNEIRFEHRVSHLNEANTLTKAEDEVTFLRSLIKLAGLPPNYKLQAASRAD